MDHLINSIPHPGLLLKRLNFKRGELEITELTHFYCDVGAKRRTKRGPTFKFIFFGSTNRTKVYHSAN